MNLLGTSLAWGQSYRPGFMMCKKLVGFLNLAIFGFLVNLGQESRVTPPSFCNPGSGKDILNTIEGI